MGKNMKKIKFRVWDLSQKEFRIDVLMLRIDGSGIASSNPEHYILQQYTGLKDKNGVEAYWQDIAKDKEGQIFIIEDNYSFLAHLETIEFEVIGNQFGNPELLKGN